MPKFALTAQIESSMKQWNKKKEEKETMEQEDNRTKFTTVSMIFTGVGIKDGILLYHTGPSFGSQKCCVSGQLCFVLYFLCVCFLTLGTLCCFLRDHFL